MLGRSRTSRSEFDALKHHTSTFSATMPFCCVSLSKPQLKWCGLRRSGLLFGGLLFVDDSEIVAASVEDWSVEGRVESCLMFRNAFSRRLYNLDRYPFSIQAVTRRVALSPSWDTVAMRRVLLRLSVRNAAVVSRQPCAVMNLHHGSASAADDGRSIRRTEFSRSSRASRTRSPRRVRKEQFRPIRSQSNRSHYSRHAGLLRDANRAIRVTTVVWLTVSSSLLHDA